MPKRTHGFLLILTVIVAAGALVQTYRFGTSLTRERHENFSRLNDLSSLEVTLANLRGAEIGYVATGQTPEGSATRAAALTTEFETTLARLRESTADPAAQARYDAVRTAFATFASVDSRARAFAATERRYEASDLVFVDAIEPLQKVTSALAESKSAEGEAARVRMATLERLQLGVVGVGMLFLLAVALFFRRVAARGSVEPQPSPLSITPRVAEPPPPPVLARPTRPDTPIAVNPAPAASSVSLADAAELCVDLARVMDGRDVPALLERAADVLGARGAVLWVADSDRDTLRPSFACGYSEKVLSRLGNLQADDDNVTSLAFRSMRAQVMGATPPATRGAIAVPLVTSAGCVGVLSAELNQTKPAQDTLDIARMIAAQVAALVGPAESASASRAVR